LRSILLGKYFDGNSLLHRLDPRAKLALLFAIVVVVLTVRTITAQLAILLVILILTSISRVPTNAVASLLKVAGWFVALTFIVHIVFTPGDEGLRLWFLTISPEGVRNGAYFGLRLLSMIWAASIIAWTTTPIAFADATEKLLKPLSYLKIPVRDIAMILLLAMRFVPTLLNDARELRLAQQARGAVFGKGSIVARVKSIIPLIVPLFVGAFRRAETTAVALTVRGYSSDIERTSLYPLKLRAPDFAVIAIAIVAVAGAALWAIFS